MPRRAPAAITRRALWRRKACTLGKITPLMGRHQLPPLPLVYIFYIRYTVKIANFEPTRIACFQPSNTPPSCGLRFAAANIRANLLFLQE